MHRSASRAMRRFRPYNPGMQPEKPYASRAGEKLAAAMDAFDVTAHGRTCADLGSNVGGFVDCLLRRGAVRVYAIDTGYGVLAYPLRRDPRVVVMERTNAMHVVLPEPVELVTIDVAWTPQRRILPAARRMLSASGEVITLIKPHYEAGQHRLQRGVLPADELDAVLAQVLDDIRATGFEVLGTIRSPIAGQGGNTEFLAHLRPLDASPVE